MFERASLLFEVQGAFDLGKALGKLIDGALLEALRNGELAGELFGDCDRSGYTGQLHQDRVDVDFQRS
jgi:hypothetical protein